MHAAHRSTKGPYPNAFDSGLDPFGNMYDETVKAHTRGAKPDWQKVNDVMLGAVRAFHPDQA